MTDRRNLNKSMDTLFPQSRSDRCRVCNEPVVDGRWNYCSERCRDIANAVQRMFLWDSVREEVKRRDEYTCQECGLSKEMWWRAYWQTGEMINDYVGIDGAPLDESARIDSPSGGFPVDHITPISEGGHPFDESNLQTLCQDCHREKTARENSTEGGRPAEELTLQDYMKS